MDARNETRAMANNYRSTQLDAESCTTCTRKLGVPYWWCAEVGQQVSRRRVCDHWEGRAK